MNVAVEKMKQAEHKTLELDAKLQEVEKKVEYLNKERGGLKNLLESKELEKKFINLEKSANLAKGLEKQFESSVTSISKTLY